MHLQHNIESSRCTPILQRPKKFNPVAHGDITRRKKKNLLARCKGQCWLHLVWAARGLERDCPTSTIKCRGATAMGENPRPSGGTPLSSTLPCALQEGARCRLEGRTAHTRRVITQERGHPKMKHVNEAHCKNWAPWTAEIRNTFLLAGDSKQVSPSMRFKKSSVSDWLCFPRKPDLPHPRSAWAYSYSSGPHGCYNHARPLSAFLQGVPSTGKSLISFTVKPPLIGSPSVII